MQKIFIVYLTKIERSGLSFAGVKETIEGEFQSPVIYSTDFNEIDEFLSRYNSDKQGLLITVLSHGSAIGVSTKDENGKWLRITYEDLLPLIARCRSNHDVFLNLTSLCNSYDVLNFNGNLLIDEIWYTRDEFDSLHKGLNAVRLGFSKFKLMDFENLYEKFRRSA